MNALKTPLRFVPFPRPMPWGGRALASLNKVLLADELYGESWDISDHFGHHSLVASGPLTGKSIRQLMEEARSPLLGPAASQFTTFPWLFKFLDACDWLSVQVHPDDVKVKQWWPGEGGKTEAWFVLEARPESRIYAGLLPGVGTAEFRKALEEGTAQHCLHSFTPQPGHCLFLPAGTVHAVGGGILMAEIQQTSDATFRLFDWNRRDAKGNLRKLHIEEGLACIDWKQGPVHPIQVSGFSRGESLSKKSREQVLVRCCYFHLDYLEKSEPFTVGGTGNLQLLAILSGRGHFHNATEEILPGHVWLLPADLPTLECLPTSSLAVFRCTLPAVE